MRRFDEFYAAGNIPEDVIAAFYDISPTDTEFSSSVEQQGANSQKKEFFEHILSPPNKDNAAVDGNDLGDDSTSEGDRRWNYCQLMERGIKIGAQAEGSASFGPNITQFDTQLEFRTQELYRDFEASTLSENASVPGSAVPAKSAGFFACVSTNTKFGGTGADGGWDGALFVAPTPGTPRALSETEIHDVCAEINVQGGNPNAMHMIPQMKTKFSNYMFTSSARVGAIYTQTQGGGNGATAVASVQMYETDHGALEVVSNNIMQPEVATPGSERTNVAIADTRYWAVATQWSVRGERLAKTGHGETWMASCSKTLLPLNERASGAIRDIDYTLDMTA